MISPCQSAFISRRWITENQVVMHELLHNFRARKVKSGMMAIKLDLQKAHDKVDWIFFFFLIFLLNLAIVGFLLGGLWNVSPLHPLKF